MLVTHSVFNLIQGRTTTYGLPTWVLLTAGLVAAAIIIAGTSRRPRIIDPRSGEVLAPSQGLAFALVFGSLTAVTAVIAVLIS